jgi:hypothetical protein
MMAQTPDRSARTDAGEELAGIIPRVEDALEKLDEARP